MAWTPYVLPYLASVAAASLAIAFVRRQSPIPAARTMLLVASATIAWSLGNSMELLATSAAAKELWVALQYPAIAILPLLWLVFAAQYSGRPQYIVRRRLAVMALVPVVTLVMVATNHLHGLMWHDAVLDASGPFPALAKTFGGWFYVLAAYSYALMLVGAVILLASLARSHQVYRDQTLLLVIAALLPILPNIAYFTGNSPVQFMDLTPPAFAVSCLLLVLGMTRFQVLDLVPAAREQVMDSLADAILVLDTRGRVVDLNPAAGELLGMRQRDAIGQPAAQLTAGDPALSALLGDLREARAEVALSREDGPVYCDILTSALDWRGSVSGWVAVLRDVTDMKQAEQENEALIGELQTALASVRTLRGLIPICSSCKKIRDDQGFWQQVEEYMHEHSEATFTHGLCPTCLKELYPDLADSQAEVPSAAGTADAPSQASP